MCRIWRLLLYDVADSVESILYRQQPPEHFQASETLSLCRIVNIIQRIQKEKSTKRPKTHGGEGGEARRFVTITLLKEEKKRH